VDCQRARSSKCSAITFRRFIRPTVKLGRRSIWFQRLATPEGIQPTRDFKAELGARRMEKIEALLAEPGLRIIAWITNLISSSQRMGAGSL
jgi:hypothetical protein